MFASNHPFFFSFTYLYIVDLFFYGQKNTFYDIIQHSVFFSPTAVIWWLSPNRKNNVLESLFGSNDNGKFFFYFLNLISKSSLPYHTQVSLPISLFHTHLTDAIIRLFFFLVYFIRMDSSFSTTRMYGSNLLWHTTLGSSKANHWILSFYHRSIHDRIYSC
jgi:hypothetical protein